MSSALGIDVGGTKIRGGLVDQDGSVSNVKEFPTEAARGGSHVVSQIITLIHQFNTKEVMGIGIGAAGQVGLGGEILSSTETFPGWAGTDLEQALHKATGLPVRVVNDVQAMAIGELHYGFGKGIANFVCVALGTGVGGAMVTDGQLYRGASGCAGEVGHMILKAGGRHCPCGNQGCLEAYVSGEALGKRYEELVGHTVTAYDFFNDLKNLGQPASLLLAQYLEDLVYGISSIANIMNPQRIILGGGLAKELVAYANVLDTLLKRYLQSAAYEALEIAFSSLGGHAMIMGAGSLLTKGGF
ncbi:ROK family protein [Paenibacillus oryzisoli]|uniref:ROK family protein n=1 Tax=Paenibacillus oryzisoli TaxID=1850517 RepID=UPI003D2D7687